jgi:hypothetical protein
MGLEQNAEQHYREVVDKYIEPMAHYHMNTRDYVVRPQASGATGAFTIILPPVAEAKGRIYSFLCRDADVTNTVTLVHNGDSEGWSNIVMNATGEACLLYSDGVAWFTLFSLLNL